MGTSFQTLFYRILETQATVTHRHPVYPLAWQINTLSYATCWVSMAMQSLGSGGGWGAQSLPWGSIIHWKDSWSSESFILMVTVYCRERVQIKISHEKRSIGGSSGKFQTQSWQLSSPVGVRTASLSQQRCVTICKDKPGANQKNSPDLGVLIKVPLLHPGWPHTWLTSVSSPSSWYGGTWCPHPKSHYSCSSKPQGL